MGSRKRLSTFFGPSRSRSADAIRVPMPPPPAPTERLPVVPASPVPTNSPTIKRKPLGTRKISKDRRDLLRASDDDVPAFRASTSALPTDIRRSFSGPGPEPVLDEPLPPPPVIGGAVPVLASPLNSNPTTPIGSRPTTPKSGLLRHSTMAMSDTKLHKRKSWFPGSSSKNKSKSESGIEPPAWVIGHNGKLKYNLAPLLRGEQVAELWQPEGDTNVYLFPPNSGKGPSFRVDSSAFASSQLLTRIVHGKIYSSPNGNDRNSASSPESSVPSRNGSHGSSCSWPIPDPIVQENNLYVPLKLSTDSHVPTATHAEPKLSAPDIDMLVSIRNLFAFLMGQSLVATDKRPNIFSIFIQVSELLKSYEFSNMDGSTYGEVANGSFECYVDELELADVRLSREKTIEAILLGERMRSVKLYNEGFIHAAGKYADITGFGSPKFLSISPATQSRLERASMDLGSRLQCVDGKLTEFEFPSIFSGIMSSKVASERKLIRFDQWKTSYLNMRKHVLAYYKKAYGSWPPKASSKKNELETSGLNRLVLRDIYKDFAQLYDLLVDRESLTTRSADAVSTVDDLDDENERPLIRSLRRVLSEFDHSTPPVRPPMPFDLPRFPSLTTTNPNYGTGNKKKDAKLRDKKIKNEEVNKMLRGSYNSDSLQPSPFLVSFFELERKHDQNRTIEEIVNNRAGQWIFMYAVMQSLPMVVIDAPNLKWSQGVEYFLCEVPRSGVPWQREDTVGPAGGRNWYGIAGGSGVVNLPIDVVEHGVEGIFRRSHCWERAKKWTEGNAVLSAAIAPENQDIANNPLPAPPGFDQRNGSVGSGFVDRANGSVIGSRPGSRSSSPSRQSVVVLGLDKLPVPNGVAPGIPRPPRRPQSSCDETKTFDSILGPATATSMTKAEKRRTRKLTS